MYETVTHSERLMYNGDSPLPEPVLLEYEGALLQRHSLGLHEEEAHERRHADHTDGKEEEGCPLQHKRRHELLRATGSTNSPGAMYR